MSADKFYRISATLQIAKVNQDWFPKWIFRFASHLKANRDTDLEVTTDLVIVFLKQLRDSEVPAWKRLQATRAIQCYRSEILKRKEPTLDFICAKLHEVAAMEGGSSELQIDSEHEKMVAENIDSSLSKHLQAMQGALRLRHYAIETLKPTTVFEKVSHSALRSLG